MVVYVAQARPSGHVKIGHTENLGRRIIQLNGFFEEVVLLYTLPYGTGFEDKTHMILSGSRRRGEWFRPTTEVMAWVEAHRPSGEGPPAIHRKPLDLIQVQGHIDAFDGRYNGLLHHQASLQHPPPAARPAEPPPLDLTADDLDEAATFLSCSVNVGDRNGDHRRALAHRLRASAYVLRAAPPPSEAPRE